MRGQVKIASQRAPYLRAGLGWPTREPVIADIRTLDGARLLELVTDPVLTVMVGTDGDTFRPFPAPAPGEQHSAEQLQLMIEALAEELPPIGAEAPAEPADQAAMIAQLQGELSTAQDLAKRAIDQLDSVKSVFPFEFTLGGFMASFEDVHELMEGYAAVGRAVGGAGFSSVDTLISAHSSAVGEVGSLRTQLGTANETIAALTSERDAATEQVATLEAEVAKLTPAKRTKPNTKPAAAEAAP